ncbi:MAG: MBL fold metallo-hydrolase [Candidatus Aminicenantes bacterium]|nr:MBL fold metallo-hydrolase [Candidatus Aminicenantes bacterium]
MTTDHNLKIQRLETSPYGTNTYIVTSTASMESVLIDAPGEAERVLQGLGGTTPRYLLITHSHFDHTGSLKSLKEELKIPVAAHAADASRLPETPDIYLEDGDHLTFGKHALWVLHTPGHTPGSLCFLLKDILFSGDTLFPHGPGRTANPEAFRQIVTSLEAKIFVLPDETRVFPGHGEATMLGDEKNEYAVFSGKSHSPILCGDVLWLSS